MLMLPRIISDAHELIKSIESDEQKEIFLKTSPTIDMIDRYISVGSVTDTNPEAIYIQADTRASRNWIECEELQGQMGIKKSAIF